MRMCQASGSFSFLHLTVKTLLRSGDASELPNAVKSAEGLHGEGETDGMVAVAIMTYSKCKQI
jgi:hypothetical protein